MKEEKLACLKYLGRTCSIKRVSSVISKEFPSGLQRTMRQLPLSWSISQVLSMNTGTVFFLISSIPEYDI